MRTEHDDQRYRTGWDAFATYYGPRAAERCCYAAFMARLLGNDVEAAVDAALLELDRERHDR